MKAVSLFAGAGGFEVGFDKAGIETVLQAESDAICLSVLARHWPEVKRVDDVRKVDALSRQGRCGDVERDDRIADDQRLGDASRPATGAGDRDVGREREPASRGATDGLHAATDNRRGQAGPGVPCGIDLVYGGWPCQGNSVAGKRGGLSDERSGLWHEVRRVLRELRPRWFVGENVPGLLSVCSCAVCQLVAAWADQHNQQRAAEGRTGSCRCAECLQGKRLRATHKGRDFGHVLADLDELGYGVAWRTLDARWFGVPQRRRRVFIVGCLGDARRAAQVLAFCESCGGHPAPRPETGERVAPTLVGGSDNPSSHGKHNGSDRGALVVGSGVDPEAMRPLTARSTGYRMDAESENFVVASTLTSGGHPGSNMPGRHKEDDENLVVASTVSASAGHHGHSSARGDGGDNLTAFDWQTQGSERTRPHANGEYVGPLEANKRDPLSGDMGVRRLTPVECERLQGFPDDWTRWGADGKEIADSHRYRLMGNAVATVCAQWLGYRLVEVDRQMRAEEGSHA